MLVVTRIRNRMSLYFGKFLGGCICNRDLMVLVEGSGSNVSAELILVCPEMGLEQMAA